MSPEVVISFKISIFALADTADTKYNAQNELL